MPGSEEYGALQALGLIYAPFFAAGFVITSTRWFRILTGRLWARNNALEINDSDFRVASLRLVAPIRSFFLALTVAQLGASLLAPSSTCCGPALWYRWFDVNNQTLATGMFALFVAAASNLWVSRGRGTVMTKLPPRTNESARRAPALIGGALLALAALLVIAVAAATATSTVSSTSQFGHRASVIYLVAAGVSTALFLAAVRRNRETSSDNAGKQWKVRLGANSLMFIGATSMAAACMSIHQSGVSLAEALTESSPVSAGSIALTVFVYLSRGAELVGYYLALAALFGFYVRPAGNSRTVNRFFTWPVKQRSLT